MELLIPGLIIVALMVYASTRIKKTAAAAFEAEEIETDEFFIQKPTGFLHNLNGDPKYLFEAYSKEFSKADDKRRAGTATITKIANARLDVIAKELSNKSKTHDDISEIIDGQKYRLLTASNIDGESKIETSFKLAENKGAVYKLEVVALDEMANEPWVETFIDSFRVK